MGKHDSKKDLEQAKKKSIEDLLTETDKELIRRLSEEHASKIDEIIEAGEQSTDDKPTSPSDTADSGVETVHVISAESITSGEKTSESSDDPAVGELREKENTGHSSGYSSKKSDSS